MAWQSILSRTSSIRKATC